VLLPSPSRIGVGGVSDAPSREGSSESEKMTKPNCTITTRHKELLRELAESRYGTQSAALRVAIDELAASVNDGETATQQMITEIQQLNERLRSVEKQLEEETTAHVEEQPPQRSPSSRPTDEVAAAIDSNDHVPAQDLTEEVYSVLSDSSPMRMPEIANEVNEPELAVRRAITDLLEKDIVATTESKDSKFQTNTPGC
jgi:Arc/MetJ-type ribon-helix-helix transcriptional regulator